MKVTVGDLMHLRRFGKMRLIAGASGLNKEVLCCGILDYELDRSLKDTYIYTNFQKGQFTLTSFLYAKDNEFLIGEAVKHLVSNDVCALAIKNVFRLNIPESVLRYADSKGFPIFVMDDPTLFFEDIIIEINDRIRCSLQTDYYEKELDTILFQPLDPVGMEQHMRNLNPSVQRQFFTIFFQPRKKKDSHLYFSAWDRFSESALSTVSNCLIPYRSGLVFLYSCDSFYIKPENELFWQCVLAVAEEPELFFIGVSEPHYQLNEIRQALKESIYAMLMSKGRRLPLLSYGESGSYQTIFPYATDLRMRQFSGRILEPILAFDAENKANLLETLIEYVHSDGKLRSLAKQMGQHENTIRYRFDKIQVLTGLSYRDLNQNEQLCLAVRIHVAAELLQETDLL